MSCRTYGLFTLPREIDALTTLSEPGSRPHRYHWSRPQSRAAGVALACCSYAARAVWTVLASALQADTTLAAVTPLRAKMTTESHGPMGSNRCLSCSSHEGEGQTPMSPARGPGSSEHLGQQLLRTSR